MDIDIQPRAHNLMMPLIVIITVPVILLIIAMFFTGRKGKGKK